MNENVYTAHPSERVCIGLIRTDNDKKTFIVAVIKSRSQYDTIVVRETSN